MCACVCVHQDTHIQGKVSTINTLTVKFCTLVCKIEKWLLFPWKWPSGQNDPKVRIDFGLKKV